MTTKKEPEDLVDIVFGMSDFPKIRIYPPPRINRKTNNEKKRQGNAFLKKIRQKT